MHTYTLTKAELVKARNQLEELRTIAHETKILSIDFPLLESLWNKANNIDELTESYKHALDVVLGTQETSHDIFIVGEYAYSFTDYSSKYPKTTEVYKQGALAYFRALAQALAYKHYNIVDDLRRVQAQEHADHIQYLLDIGCTEQELIKAGLFDVCIPFSACPKRITMGVYSGE